MKKKRQNDPYPLFVGLLLAPGLFLDLFAIKGILKLEPVLPPDRWLEPWLRDAPFLFHLFTLAALIPLTVIVYLTSLSPYRERRPRVLIFLNLLPLTLHAGCMAIAFAREFVESTPILAGGALAIGLLLPLPIYLIENILGGIMQGMGRTADTRGWPDVAAGWWRNSLRWRPAVPEAVRRLGLLAADQERWAEARTLLEQLGSVAGTTDPDQLRALERIYFVEGEPRKLLETLERQQTLKPGKAIDLRVLEQAVAMEEWEKAVSTLQAGRIPMDMDRQIDSARLQVRAGQLGQAIGCVERIKQMEKPPYPKAVALAWELLGQAPEFGALRIYLGLTLLETTLGDQMQRGAELIEQALERDPMRTDLRRPLAEYYQRTLQYNEAERHLRPIAESHPEEIEVRLSFAETLKMAGRRAEALAEFEAVREAFALDWRAPFRQAELLAPLDRLEEARQMLDVAQPLAPEASRGAISALRLKVRERIEELKLQAISRDMADSGEDLQRRLQIIEQLLALGRGEQAVAECDALLESHPDLVPEVEVLLKEALVPRDGEMQSFRVRDYLSDIYFRRGQYDQVLELCEQMATSSLHPEQILEEGCRRILARNPDYLPARLRFGEVAMGHQKWEQVMEAYGPIFDNPPGDQAVLIQTRWTEAAYRAGKFAEAAEAARRIRPGIEDNVEFLILMLHILEAAEDFEGALEVHQFAAGRFPEDDTLRRMRRGVLDRRRRARMKLLLAMDENEGLTAPEHYELAGLHHEYQEVHEAIIRYQKAAEDPQWHDIATTRMAVCLCERRLFDIADETLNPLELNREKTQRHQELKDMFYWVADTLEYEGYKPAALKYFKRIFRVDAAFRDVVRRLEKLDGA